MKKMVILVILAVFLTIPTLPFLGQAEWKETEISRFVSLPRNIKIVPPSADLSKEIAGFSGRWEGVSDASIKTVLIIEEITAEKVKLIYGWSRLSPYMGPDYIRVNEKLKLISGKPQIKFSMSGPFGSTTFAFKLSENLQTIQGNATRTSGPDSNVILEKVDD